ncbi:MAG: glycosyltransferase family 32 protein [Cetobacterium sp.]
MIPKKIHYFWFGGAPKSKFIQNCIESWKKLGYEIFEWNENNYDFNKHIYLSENYKNKRWAFVSDYTRLDILYNEGGLYFDTDVKIIKEIPNEILETDFLLGFQFDCLLGSHFIGSKKECKLTKKLLDIYDTYDINKNEPNNHVFTDFFIENVKTFKLNGQNQKIEYFGEKVSIFEKSFFSCPKLFNRGYAFHLLDNSWKNKNNIKKKIQAIIKMVIGNNIYYNLLCKKAFIKSPYKDTFGKVTPVIERKKSV